MMGRQKGRQPKLFYEGINIEERVSQKHILRKIKKVLDFDFIEGGVDSKTTCNHEGHEGTRRKTMKFFDRITG